MHFIRTAFAAGPRDAGQKRVVSGGAAMIGDMYPSRKRAQALGLFMLGLPLGSLVCFALVGRIAQDHGWRMPFYVAAVPGFLVALLALLCREPVRGAQEAYKVDAAVTLDRPYRRVMSIPTLWWIILSGAAVNFASHALTTFLPALMVRYHQASVAKAGAVSAVVLGVTGLLGLTLGGWVAGACGLSAWAVAARSVLRAALCADRVAGVDAAGR